ncbi:uncharacterized protein [Rutidosis leptorrhynchoides]|uniref:uncharacterized protein isoform X1 n=1 Tax=Rutidosis leptorrhynchoides TaxID=125765 RepID=UPI003A9988D6
MHERQKIISEKHELMINKKVVAPWIVDWEPLTKECLDSVLNSLLTQYYRPYVGKICFYEDWKELVVKHAELPIYPEVCREFHSTYKLKVKPNDMDDKEFMRFKLGGKVQRMSLMDFTRCLKIYTRKQMDEKHFRDYIWLGARVSDMNEDDYLYKKADCGRGVSDMNEDDFHYYKADQFWEFISKSSGSTWSPGNVSCLDIDFETLRLSHLVLTHNITHRTEDTDKVLLSDLWFLHKMMSIDKRVNIPYCVAYYLKHWATGVDRNSPICGGHYVTLIAHHLQVKCDEEESLLDRRRSISVSEYNNAKLLTQEEEKPKTEPSPSKQQLPYTTSYTALYLLTWLTNLELIYKYSLSVGNKLEKFNQEPNLSENIQMLLDLIDEIEQFLRSVSLNSKEVHPENVIKEEPEIERLDPLPTTVTIHEIVTCMHDVRFALEHTLMDKNELLRLQRYWTLTEYVRQISDRLAGFKESSLIKLAEIGGVATA